MRELKNKNKRKEGKAPVKVRYRKAYSNKEKTELVCIDSLLKKNTTGKIYYCISCGQPLVAKKGKIRAPHFSHKKWHPLCNHETYLQTLAKLNLFKTIKFHLENEEPLLLETEEFHVCNKCSEADKEHGGCLLYEKIDNKDLFQWFDRVYIDTAYKNFTPDILMIGKNNKPLFIEIAVKHHPCSQEIIDSGEKTIEIFISNEEEAEKIGKSRLSLDNCKNYNFKVKTFKHDYSSPSKCKKDHEPRFVVLFLSGKVSILKKKQITPIDVRMKIHGIKKFKYNQELSIISELKNIYNNDLNIRNCHLCKYHKQILHKDYLVFCKKDRRLCSANKATVCDLYLPKEKYFSKIETFVPAESYCKD